MGLHIVLLGMANRGLVFAFVGMGHTRHNRIAVISARVAQLGTSRGFDSDVVPPNDRGCFSGVSDCFTSS